MNSNRISFGICDAFCAQKMGIAFAVVHCGGPLFEVLHRQEVIGDGMRSHALCSFRVKLCAINCELLSSCRASNFIHFTHHGHRTFVWCACSNMIHRPMAAIFCFVGFVMPFAYNCVYHFKLFSFIEFVNFEINFKWNHLTMRFRSTDFVSYKYIWGPITCVIRGMAVNGEIPFSRNILAYSSRNLRPNRSIRVRVHGLPVI